MLGMYDLPQHIDMYVKGHVYEAWNKMFDVFDRSNYTSCVTEKN